MKIKLTFLILLVSVVFANAQTKINWLSIEEAYAKQKITPKKVLIDVYTGWCGWCKVMDRETFTNAEVINYVNQNYYAVKLDAESKKIIKLGTSVYKYDETNRSNEVAIALLQGKMSYPSIVYLDESFNMIQPVPGYMNAKDFHQIITYFGGNYHKKEQFENYKGITYSKLFAKKAM
jgi:thioredoxin-related protein